MIVPIILSLTISVYDCDLIQIKGWFRVTRQLSPVELCTHKAWQDSVTTFAKLYNCKTIHIDEKYCGPKREFK